MATKKNRKKTSLTTHSTPSSDLREAWIVALATLVAADPAAPAFDVDVLAVDPSSKAVGWALWRVSSPGTSDAGALALLRHADACAVAKLVASGASTDGGDAMAIRDRFAQRPIVVIEKQFVGLNPAAGMKILEHRVRVQVRAEDAGCKVVLVSNSTWQWAQLVVPGESWTIPGKPARPATAKRPAKPATADRVVKRPPSDVLKARSRLLALTVADPSCTEDQADAVNLGRWATNQMLGANHGVWTGQ